MARPAAGSISTKRQGNAVGRSPFWKKLVGFDAESQAPHACRKTDATPSAESWNREEDRMERRFDDGVEHVEEFPEDAARWTGEAVGEVEAVPDRVEEVWDRAEENVEEGWDRAGENIEEGWERTEENVEEGWDRAGENIEDGWDETVDAVENAPENIAEGIGEGVGEVERFGDSVEDYGETLEESYEEGRDEARYD
jgi:hypothetical protein